MKIGGLDVGTTGCKLTVFDEKGNELGKSYRAYPVHRIADKLRIVLNKFFDSKRFIILIGLTLY